MSINPLAALAPAAPTGGAPLGFPSRGALANPMGTLGGVGDSLTQSEDLKEEMILQLMQQIPQLQQQLQQVQGQQQQTQDQQQVQALQQQAMQIQLKLAADQVLLAELTGQDPSQQQPQQPQGQAPNAGAPPAGGSPGGGSPAGGAPGGSPGGGAPAGGGPGGGGPGGGGPVGALGGSPTGGAPDTSGPDLSAFPMTGTDQQKADFINQYLASKGSPAAGMNAGQMMVQAGKQNNVDPLILLSIAGQETQFGKKGVGVNGMLGVGAYDADPRNSTRNPTFSGVRNQIFKGAATFAKLRARGGASANSPISQQLAAVNRAGWATDRGWHNGVGAQYAQISRAGAQYAQSHPAPPPPPPPPTHTQPTQVASSGK
ncbi:MAG: hypothetical protein ACYCW6_01385 [Candidatus Xenobia bacterium]